jgi:hypothetical protein
LARGAQVALNSDSKSFRIRSDHQEAWREYKIPILLAANQYRLPGWFTAAIWDDLRLPSLNWPPDPALLTEWGFLLVEATYRKELAPAKELLYYPANGLLLVRNTVANSLTEVRPLPPKSPFHAEKLFEEQSFFADFGEEAIPSLTLQTYQVPCE